jgi:hypothetical protein
LLTGHPSIFTEEGNEGKGDAIAGAVLTQSLKEAIVEAGLYAIEQSGDTMKISVPEDFRPREW